MNKEKKFFDAEFEIDLLKIYTNGIWWAQKRIAWLLVLGIIGLSIGLILQSYSISDIKESVAIMQCEKDAQKIGASFTFVDGECSILYSE